MKIEGRLTHVARCASLIAVAGLAFFLFGCQSVNTVERAVPQATPTIIADRRIETDPQLARKVSVVQVSESKVGDLLRIQVQLYNKTRTYAEFNYQFVWIQQDGVAVTSPAAVWRENRIYGGETVFVSAVAPNPQVVDFQLKLLGRKTFEQTQGAPVRRKR